MELSPQQIAQIADAASDMTITKMLTADTTKALARGLFTADDILNALPDEPNPANKYITFVTWTRKIGQALIKKR